MSNKTNDNICTVMRLRRATRKATRLYDRHFADLGIGIAQYGIMQTIAQAKRTSISDIADALDMERTTLTRNLKPLIASGLVAVGEGNDKRTRSVIVTDKGKKLLKQARSVWQKAQKEVRTEMGEAELRKLHRLLADMLERLPNP